MLKRSRALSSRVREYFIEAANICKLDVNALLNGPGRLSKLLQEDSIQDPSTSHAISPSKEQDLARSESTDAVPNDAASNGVALNDSALYGATNNHQASPSTPSSEASVGNISVATTAAPSAGITNKRTHTGRSIPVPANPHDDCQSIIGPHHHMPMACPLRKLPDSPVESARSRDCGTEVDRSPPRGADLIVPLATSEDQHINSTAPSRSSRQPGHQQNQPLQSSLCENFTMRASVVTNSTQPDTELVRQYRTVDSNVQVTGQPRTGSFVTMTTPSINQTKSAPPDTTDHYALQDPNSLHTAMQRPEVGISSLPPLSVPNQECSGYRFEGIQHLEHQMPTNVEHRGQQDVAIQTAIFSPNTNDWIRTASVEANGGLCRFGLTDRPGLHFQTPVPMTQGIGWDGMSLSAQRAGCDPEYWLTHFPLDIYN